MTQALKEALGFTISDGSPRILTETMGGCRPAGLHEIAMWDALSAQAQALSDEHILNAASNYEYVPDGGTVSNYDFSEDELIKFARALIRRGT